MAESAAYARRTFLGGAQLARIPGGLNAGVMSTTADDLSSWVGATANGPHLAMLDREGANPEEVEISAVSGNNITFSARGLRGTDDSSHDADVTIELIGSPRDNDEANYWVAELAAAITAAGDLMYADGDNSLARLAKGTAFHLLRMNSGATAPEWGAIATAAAVATSEGTTSTSYTDLATAGPAVTLTTGATALVIVSATWGSNSGSGEALMSFAVSGASTVAADDARSLRSGAGAAVTRGMSRTVYLTGLTPGSNTFTAKYAAKTTGTATFADRHIVVIPL